MTRTQAPYYGRALIALLMLTAISYGASYVGLGTFAVPVALAIAAVKVGIVLTCFMHVRREVASAGLGLVLAAFFVTIFIVFVILEMTSRASFAGA